MKQAKAARRNPGGLIAEISRQVKFKMSSQLVRKTIGTILVEKGSLNLG
jgi:hypothetical protein